MMKKKLLTLLAAAVLLPVMAVPLPSDAEEEEQHECTSWIVMPNLTGGKYMMLHKNRDSIKSRQLHLLKAHPEGKYAWISISNRNSNAAYAGINVKGLAVAMNSGDQTEFYSDKNGLYTPYLCRDALENCATAEEAVRYLHKVIIEDRNYQHQDKGSMWFIIDGKKAFIIEHDAVHFGAHEVKTNFAIRANAWHFPEMIMYSKRTMTTLVNHHRREFAVRRSMFADGTKYKEPVDHEKIAVASRIDLIPEDPKCPPLCNKSTNCASTLRIDCEYPETLSTMYAAFGPPRYTPYLPVPYILEDFPKELTEGTFCDAVFARYDAKRELLPQDKLVEFERELYKRHDEATEKARAVLKKGGSVEEVKKILGEAFRKNWEAVKKLSEEKPAPETK
ncbi:MAG: hypothetical protein IJS14_14820 [Lentisphaeria bacterium]|nr:hypothetical protein [Lentisphaeria bacterium]